MPLPTAIGAWWQKGGSACVAQHKQLLEPNSQHADQVLSKELFNNKVADVVLNTRACTHMEHTAYTNRGGFQQHLAEMKERETVLENAILASRESDQSNTAALHEYTESEKTTHLAKFQRLHIIGFSAFTLLSVVFIGVGSAEDDWKRFKPTVGFSNHQDDHLPLPHMHTMSSFAPFPFVFVITIIAALYHLVCWFTLHSEAPTSKYYMFDQQCNPLRWVDHSISLVLLNVLLALCVGIHDVHLWFALACLVLLGNASYGLVEVAAKPFSKLEHHVHDVIWLSTSTITTSIWRIGSGLILATWFIYFCYLGNLPNGGIQVNSQVFIGLTFLWQAFIMAISFAYSLLDAPKFHQVDYAYLVASVMFRVTITIQLYFVFV